MKENYRILVVDDAKVNREVLAQELAESGYEVIPAASGPEALDLLERGIDLVILDVIMPEMDGFEVARRIRANPRLRSLPIVMITALQTAKDRVDGIEAGADDFISKPFNALELRARVKALLKISEYYRKLEESYETIHALQQMKDDLMDMLIHDMGDVLTLIIGYMSEIRTKTAEESVRRYAQKSLDNAFVLRNMRDNLLDIRRMEEGRLPIIREPCNLREVVEEVAAQFEMMIQEKDFKLQTDLKDLTVNMERAILKRIVQNLLLNAIKHNAKGTTITMTADREDLRATVAVEDNGKGIPSELRDKIFEKFAQADLIKKGCKYGKGLGLTFCRLTVEAYGGRIWVESTPGRGSRFVFEVPD